MFQGLQLSGILLCYGPLALVVFGFIAFALITDKISTRTYLRNMDPRPEDECDEPVVVKAPVQGITPSGLVVAVTPDESPLSMKGDSRSIRVDDLTRLEGIGPKIKSVLAAAGITSFSQVAQMTPQALRAVLDKAGIGAINDPTSWPEQAALAAQGNWTELKNLQDKLQGGKRS